MARQKAITPPLSNCFCGSTDIRLYEDWDFRNLYRAECSNGHYLTKYCKRHRAVCIWNNRVDSILKGDTSIKIQGLFNNKSEDVNVQLTLW